MPSQARVQQHRPQNIPGIYNWCDSWCSRCAFTARCRVFQITSAAERAIELGEDPGLERLNTPLSPQDEVRLGRLIDRKREWVDAHPLSGSARDYGTAACQIIIAIDGMSAGRLDAVVTLALATIRHFAYLIPAKTHRALGGLAEAAIEDDDGASLDDDDRMYDSNGSARITRIGIEQSREAWRVLNEAGLGDGVADDMILRLSELDAATASAFPGEATFRRPGFDD
jgi:hypothetical protein